MTTYTADDFQAAEFARHPRGMIAARVRNGFSAHLYPWRCSDIHGRSDYAMAEDGWVPVQECPNPDQHDDRYVSPLAVERVQELQLRADGTAEGLEITLGRAIKGERERDQALAMAQLWKETARELFGARNGSRAALRHWHDKHDHPLTAADITDEMVVRFWNVFEGNEEGLEDMQLRDIDEVRTALSAALTPPPSRPVGAVEIETDLATLGDTMLPMNDVGRADLLASLGYRKAEDGGVR